MTTSRGITATWWGLASRSLVVAVVVAIGLPLAGPSRIPDPVYFLLAPALLLATTWTGGSWDTPHEAILFAGILIETFIIVFFAGALIRYCLSKSR